MAITGVAVLLIAGASVVGNLRRPAADAGSGASPSPTAGVTGQQAPSTSTQPDRPPTRASGPQEALDLSSRAALAQLRDERAASLAAAADLAYSWVPQVSSKCVGLPRVDIKGPSGFFPDGQAETRNPGNPEILAFHLALSQRYDTVTLLWRDISPRARNYPVCDDSAMMWSLMVAQRFRTADGANGWCADEGFPAGECFARYLVPRGQVGTKYQLR